LLVTLTRRDAQPNDAARITQLYAAYDAVEFGYQELELDDVERMLAIEGSNRCIVEDAERLLGYADVGRSGEVETLVDPAYVGARELQADLIEWVIENARARGLTRVEHWAGTGAEGAGALLTAAGFVHARSMWRLRRSVTEPLPEPRWPTGVALRAFNPETDARVVWQVVQTSFAGTYGSHQRPYDEWALFALGEGRDVICSVEHGEIIGIAAVGARNGEGHVGQLAVLPGARGRGLATALLHEAFRRDAAAGLEATTLEVDGENDTARRLYEKAGMAVDREYRRWERDV
jgi:ribosomal protein S18 acetylase RimI-like enzyme